MYKRSVHFFGIAASSAKQFLDALKLIGSASKSWAAVWVCLLLLQGLLPVALVYAVKFLVDALVAVAGAGVTAESIRSILVPVASIAGILLLKEVLQLVSEYVRVAQTELIWDRIHELVHTQATSLDLSFFETPALLDIMHRSRDNLGARSVQLIESAGGILQNGITLIGMASVLLTYGAWLPVVLVLGAVPAFRVALIFNRRYHAFWKSSTVDWRWAQYWDQMLTDADAAAEVRLFNLGPLFRSRYAQRRNEIRAINLRLNRSRGLSQFIATSIALLVTGGVMATVVVRFMRGDASLGDVALFYQVLNSGQGLMRTLMSNLGQIHSATMFISSLLEFLALEPRVAESPAPRPAPLFVREGVEFRDVVFTYPGADVPALKGVNLRIPAGKTVAVVGSNGAGKSTLIKLLCRFYDPETGCIEIDGVNIREFSLEDLQRLFSVLFQRPVRYADTAEFNVRMFPHAGDSDVDLTTAAKNAGADTVISDLPLGWKTLLGKSFDGGTELSRGQWQRIVLARALYRRSPVLVLDEPTSFMDTAAEQRWQENFGTLVRERTALIITHRYSTAMLADLVYVMRDGRIVESGAPDVLLRKGAEFSRLTKDAASNERVYDQGLRRAVHVPPVDQL